VRPGPDVSQQPQARDRQTARPVTDVPHAQALAGLSEEERRLIDVLQTQRHGMTLRQLQAKLSGPTGGLGLLLESLQERQLVARLNTVVPSYIYRYGGVDLNAE
jgi:hypothetical protein